MTVFHLESELGLLAAFESPEPINWIRGPIPHLGRDPTRLAAPRGAQLQDSRIEKDSVLIFESGAVRLGTPPGSRETIEARLTIRERNVNIV